MPKARDAAKRRKPSAGTRAKAGKTKASGAAKGRRLKPNAAQLAIINAWVRLLPPELRTHGFAELGIKAMLIPEFRAALVRNPSGALKKMDLGLRRGVRVAFHDNDSSRFHVVLPPAANEGRQIVIRDEDLKSQPVSSGSWFQDDFFRDPNLWRNRKNDGPRGDPGADTWDMLNKVADTRDPHSMDTYADRV